MFTDVGSLFAGVLIAICAALAGLITPQGKLADIFFTVTQLATALFIGLGLARSQYIGRF